MRAVSLVGYKKSGKTTLAVDLARELTARGLAVSAAKFSHHALDKTDTDTAKLAEVCVAVAGFDPDSTALFWRGQKFLPDLIPLMRADVLVVEGGKSLGWLPRVLLLRSPGEAPELTPELALGVWSPQGMIAAPGMHAIGSVGELADTVLTRGFALPGLDCGACGHAECRGLAAEIVAGRAAPKDCKARGGGLTVRVGEAEMALNPFTASVVRGAIEGMLSQLKGYAPGQPIRIELD